MNTSDTLGSRQLPDNGAPFRLGIDLGGTKIEAMVLDTHGQTVFNRRIDSPSQDYQQILDAIQALVIEAEAAVGESLRVGLGTPGALSPATGLLRNSNTVCMNGRNLRGDLEQQLQRPLRIANDANCFALSEAIDGSAANYEVVFGVIIGTGTGGGIVIKQQLLTGPHAIAGEWGHNPLPWLKQNDVIRDCYCGKRGCIETFLSGPGFAANARVLSGRDWNSHEWVEAAGQGDDLARQQLDIYYDQMARALAHLINILDPDAIVLGGGMSNIEGIYQQLPALLMNYVFSDHVSTPILAPRFGDASGVRGAAWLW